MNRVFGMAAVLGASLCVGGLAHAQDATTTTQMNSDGGTTTTTTTTTPPSSRMVTTPVIVNQGGAIAARPEPGAAVATAPLNMSAPMAAPYHPAPVGTVIETTADHRIVRTQNGFDTTFDV